MIRKTPALRIPTRWAAWVPSLLFCSALGLVAEATFIDPSDPDLRYTGRWDHSNPAQPWCQAKGSSIIAEFEGTSLSVTLLGTSNDYLRMILDGDATSSVKLQLQPGVLMPLASGLVDGVHRIELIKETDQGRMTFRGFELDDGKSLAPPPPRPARRIEFYGDSNLAGNSLESERDQGNVSLRGSYFGLAGSTARMLDAEYVNFSRSGATTSSLLTAHDRVDWNSSTPLWDFGSFPADAVVLNIGANDFGTPAQIKQRYHALLDAMRAAHPAAHVVLFNARGWSFDEPANFIHEVIAEHGDANMSWQVFPWFFEQFHGCEYDHGGMAQVLVDHLAPIMGWRPAASDVLNGFGVDGGLANGSFEQVAPFGGWGWRYFDSSGVSRILDPATAKDGDFYLRLSDGATSHQNTPAEDGQTLIVSAWMRGSAAGDEVSVTMDFRDQDAGAGIATPMQTETEIMILATTWQLYEMSASAPTDPVNPVFHSRVTFTATQGAIEIDEVSLDGSLLFADGFESGDFQAWSTVATTLGQFLAY